MLEEFRRFMPTTWNLGKQCVEPARVFDEGLQRIFGILEIPGGRRQCQVLTQSEVLHFVGWQPYLTREEFDKYRAEHPELEPFPPYDFNAPSSEREPEDGGDDPPGHSPYVSNLGKRFPASNAFHFFAGMATDKEKEHYKNLLGKDKAKARAQKKQLVVPSSSRPASQPIPPKPQQQQQE